MTREICGIDVSEWQRTIDWERVAADGAAFAMIRATHGLKRDACFERNIEGALAAGIAVGVYCCSYATTVEGVRAEAAFFLETIRPWRDEIAYPAAFDAEQDAQFALGRRAVTELIVAFCGAVTDAGYVPLVYTNCNWLNNVIDKEAVADAGIDVWVSWTKSAPSFAEKPIDGVSKHAHTMWQFSAVGKVDGIEGDVDLNVSYVDYAHTDSESDGAYITLEEAKRILAELGYRGIIL